MGGVDEAEDVTIGRFVPLKSNGLRTTFLKGRWAHGELSVNTHLAMTDCFHI
jgi:hypothetical protein